MIAFQIGRLLEKLGMNEYKSYRYERKIANFEDWLHRNPITIMNITLPDLPNNQWTQVEASLDNAHVKLVSQSGVWRKTYVWQSNAKVSKE